MVLVLRQAQLIIQLYESGGSLTTTELARSLHLLPQHIAQIARACQELGLVERKRRGQKVTTTLTEKGKEIAPLLKQLLEKLQQ